MNLIALSIILPWCLVALAYWFNYQLLRQLGRMLLRVDDIERRLAHGSTPAAYGPLGLQVGTEAPGFGLPDLHGSRYSLAQFRGRKVLLIFFNPACGHCRAMAADLATISVDGSVGAPLPLIVSTGDGEANRSLVAEHNLRCPVLLQENMEVAARYQCHGTPMGYLIDERSRIASRLAVGPEGLLALADRLPSTFWRHAQVALDESGPVVLGGRKSLRDSKIERHGLSVGSTAPPFILPRLDGGELSLEQFRGLKVLLIFSDPRCAPCDELAPRLEEAYRRSSSIQVVMVSRGEVEENRAKAEAHRLTFPIVLQRQWEISRLYAMFGTPVGCLINEHGVIESGPKRGVAAILTLFLHCGAAGPVLSMTRL